MVCDLFSILSARIAAVILLGLSFIAESKAQDAVTAWPDDPMATESDRAFIRRAYEIARNAVAHGNHPFGALLVRDGRVMAEFENEVITSKDLTHHAETGLVAFASRTLPPGTMESCTLYTSTEPCLMCCGAIYWAGIQRIVYGTSEVQMDVLINAASKDRRIPSREVFDRLNPSMTIIGPVLEAEGLAIHASFWPNFKRGKLD